MYPPVDPVSTCIDAAAVFVAAQPGAVGRLRQQHRRQADGVCTGCGWRLVRWPCVLVAIADRADQIGGLRPGGGALPR